MSYGQAEKVCHAFKNWPANPGLCGRCAWPLADHKETKMQPFQQRVVDELRELSDKRDKLQAFIAGASNGVFEKLPANEQERMRRQKDIMVQYENVLKERIDNFVV